MLSNNGTTCKNISGFTWNISCNVINASYNASTLTIPVNSELAVGS